MKKAVLLLIAIIVSCIAVICLLNYPEISNSKEKVVHISFDDVEDVFNDIISHETEYTSIFDNKFLSRLREYHYKYDAKFTLYTYEKATGYNLAEFPTKYRSEFIKNSDWLKIGFHWLRPDFEKNVSVEKFSKSFFIVDSLIKNFAGDKTLTSTLRLHYFYAPDSILTIFNGGGVLFGFCRLG